MLFISLFSSTLHLPHLFLYQHTKHGGTQASVAVLARHEDHLSLNTTIKTASVAMIDIIAQTMNYSGATGPYNLCNSLLFGHNMVCLTITNTTKSKNDTIAMAINCNCIYRVGYYWIIIFRFRTRCDTRNRSCG